MLTLKEAKVPGNFDFLDFSQSKVQKYKPAIVVQLMSANFGV